MGCRSKTGQWPRNVQGSEQLDRWASVVGFPVVDGGPKLVAFLGGLWMAKVSVHASASLSSKARLRSTPQR